MRGGATLPFKNREEMRKFRLRRMRRRSEQGRNLETEIENILQKMQDDGLIESFRRFPPHSPEDNEGCDFEAVRTLDDGPAVRRFGVTISRSSWTRARVIHPKVPQFWLPDTAREDTIRKKILGLFKD